MPRLPRTELMLGLLALLIPLVFLSGTAGATGATRDPAIEARMEALLARMTLAEKIGQLHLTSRGQAIEGALEWVRAGRIGNIMNVAAAVDIARFHEAARRSRLQIPPLFGLDAVHVFRIAFPVPIAWAATWNPRLAEDAAEWVAREAAAVGINWTFAPMVDLTRDPRWGRVIEGAGEDVYLASVFAAARTRGYRRGGLETTAKHFVGYGAAEGGRDYNTALIPIPELYDHYLPPFKAALEAGSEIVMAGFHAVNGVPATAHRGLLTGILRERWRFAGAVVSDYNAIAELTNHAVAADIGAAAVKAIEAGVDLDMESYAYTEKLVAEVEAGRLALPTIDEAVRRILRVKLRMGLFEQTGDLSRVRSQPDEADIRKSARQTARESFVLLKNEGGLLPIGPGVHRIALIGAVAESDYDHSWYGPALMTKPDTQTLLAAMRARLATGQTLTYAKGVSDTCGRAFADKDAAVAAARDADLIVLAVIEDCESNGEAASRVYLGLSGVQQELLDAVAATGKPIALVIQTGRPLALLSAAARARAVLVAWHPGTEGRPALAEVLFGEVAPSGKLPMTFPRSVGQIPIYYNRLPTGRPPAEGRFTSRYVDEEATPLYPFGWGLSYTNFDYSALALGKSRLGRDETLELSVTVRNSGQRAGQEVVQLYTRQLVASRSRPVRELKAFQKIALAPGESRLVRLNVRAADLGYHDEEGRYVVEPGSFQIFVGGSSLADLSAQFELAP